MVKGQISVIMGIYNCADTLPEALDSLISQTYTNWRLIMCDDASTDDTYKIAKEYQNKYPDKIVLIRNKVNSKLAFTLNHCLKYADGEFIARMDGDDISVLERFEKQVNFLNEHLEIDLVGTYMQRFNDNGFTEVVKTPLNPNRFTLKNSTPFFHATIMARKKVYDLLDGYRVSKVTERAEDFDLWFRFFYKDFEGKNIPEALYLVREDLSAMRRRTSKSRWRAFKIRRYGYKLLGYPKWWIIKSFFITLFKSSIPVYLISIYNNFKNKEI